MTSDSSHPMKSTIVLRVIDVRHRFNEFVNRTSSLHLDDAYIITATADGDTGLIDVAGQTPAGVFYGVQTLLCQMSDGRRVIAGELIDAPRFSYRGLMLDVSRNFIAKDIILRTIDAMAAYKMNRLHLHLTDDQGWRLDVPGLPELTAVGARRGHHRGPDGSRRSTLLAYLGSGPSPDDASRNGGAGFYSREDYRDILRHARQRHVIVVPEVDVPGHSLAAIESMQATQGRENMTLVDPENDMFEYLSINGYKNNLMNMCLKSSLSFVEYIISTLVDLHKVCH